MKHLRQHYLEQIQSQLKTIDVIKGVWIQRTRRKQARTYPNVTVFAIEETVLTPAANVNFDSLAARSQTRTVPVAVRVWVNQNDDAEKLERDFNDVSLKIETTLKNTFGAVDLILQGTDFSAHEQDEEEPNINSLTLTYHLVYYSEEFNPSI